MRPQQADGLNGGFLTDSHFGGLFSTHGTIMIFFVAMPCYGIFSEVISTFSGKRIYGYTSLVYATLSISVLSLTVWLHHLFTIGQSANANAAFGVVSMFIAFPTGVKVYDWMAKMVRGRIRFTVPILSATGFSMLFVIGG